MRTVSNRVLHQRGCGDCVFFIRRGWHYYCRYAECRFPELDQYEAYKDYLRETKNRKKILKK